MSRWLVIALVVSSCAKNSKDAAVDRSGAVEPAVTQTPAPPPPPTPAPGEPAEAPATPPREQALEAARNGAILGPAANTSAFTEDGAGSGSATRNRQTPKGGTGSKVGTVGQGSDGGGGGGDTGAPAESHTRGGGGVKAKIGEVTSAGKTAPEPLARAIKTRLAEVQSCYDKTKASDLKGTLALTFSVMPTGAIANTSVKSTTLKNLEIESCIVGVLQKIRLMKPLGTDEVTGEVTISFAKR